MTDKELEAWENSRDLGAELLESVRQMKAGLSINIQNLPAINIQ